MKSLITRNSFLFFIFIAMTANLTAQQDNSLYIETIIKEIKERKSSTLSYASGNIHHIYEISIPDIAEIVEYENTYVIKPVEITMAIKVNSYTLEKAKISYVVTIYKEYKGSYAAFRKTDMVTIWQVRKETKEFSKILKELKSLKDTEFELLYSGEDDFPSEWKK